VQKRIAVVAMTLAAVLVATSIARTQSKDPWIGTWKVNLEKSTYSPGPPPTVAATVKIEPSAGGVKTTIDATNAEGKPTTPRRSHSVTARITGQRRSGTEYDKRPQAY